MNSPQRKILKKRTRELANISNATDLHRFHSNLLQKLEVKTVIKENHERAIEEIKYNFTKTFSKCSNMFASVGSDALTVYDDNHFVWDRDRVSSEGGPFKVSGAAET